MNRVQYYIIIFISAAVAVVLVAARPEWVSDRNQFLKNFVNHEYLNILGVILAITLASLANLHLEFNKIEERFQKKFLSKSRMNLKKGAYWLIGLFVAGLFVVILKPLCDEGETSQSIFNMIALFILLWNVLILISITNLVFAIPPDVHDK